MRIVRHVSRLAVFVLAGLVLAATVELPAWTLPLIFLDSPLTLRLSAPWLIAIVLAVLMSAGTDVLFRLLPWNAGKKLRHAAVTWILPSMVTGVGALLIARFEPLSVRWLLVFVSTSVALILSLLGEIYISNPAAKHARVVQAGMTFLAYTVALVVFISIYGAHVRTALSGTTTSVAGFLLAMSLLRWPEDRTDARWPYAVMAALIIGLATWGLNRASLNGVTGGGVLLLEFYVVTGIARQLIQRDFTLRVLVEFAVVVTVGLLLIGALGGGR